MGKPKRKIEEDTEEAPATMHVPKKAKKEEKEVEVKKEDTAAAPAASNYAMKAHSGEIIHEDVYISDGSEDEDEDIDVVLTGSRMGIMRRGLAQANTLVQPNRQWVREDNNEDKTEEEDRKQQELEIELANLDPEEREARLLAEQKKKEEEDKIEARRLESEENAGRDPTLFSKRTAFDIRFDQIEDKPWERGTDMTEFFNYNFSEEEWVEYAARQLEIRQELIDAMKARRPPNPNIVPVQPKAPKKQLPRVAVIAKDNKESEKDSNQALGPSVGPTPMKKEESKDQDMNGPQDDIAAAGGAWGAGAEPGSMLAKLIEEQERAEAANFYQEDPYSRGPPPPGPDSYYGDFPPGPPPPGPPPNDYYGQPPPDMPPPPPPAGGFRGGRGGRGRGGGRFGGRGGGRGYMEDGGRGGRKRQYDDRRY